MQLADRSMSSELRSARRASTLVLTISDAANGNALTQQICAAGVEALAVAEADATVSAVVIRGDGGDFSKGAALVGVDELTGRSGTLASSMLDALHAWIEGLRAFPKPVVAAVEGLAADAGLALALACDLVVAAEDARFVATGAAAGRSPVAGLSWQLGQRLPRGLALQWLWLGATVEARAMRELGFVAAVTPPAGALDEAFRLGERLAGVPPAAAAAAKELLDAVHANTLTRQLDLERSRLAGVVADRASRRDGGVA
jgi:enoyl-CoA hydratase/carnithine racemase